MGNWVTELHVTLIWCYTAANWKFLKPNALPQTNFPFEFLNAVWSLIILWSEECRFSFWMPFLFLKMLFSSQKFVKVVEDIWFWEFTIYTFRMPLNCGILQYGSRKCHFCLRKQFVFWDLVATVCHHKLRASSQILYCGNCAPSSLLVTWFCVLYILVFVAMIELENDLVCCLVNRPAKVQSKDSRKKEKIDLWKNHFLKPSSICYTGH